MHIIPISAFQDNYIWAIVQGNEAWIVDPGDALPVIQYLEKEALTLSGILLTHHHADHCGGVSKLLEKTSNIPVIGPNNPSIHTITNTVKEGDVVFCGSLSFTVLEIPGHTLDHIAFYSPGLLFCGDTLFSAGCGRLFEGTPAMMYASLMKIKHLPENTAIYCGHEYTLANLRFAAQIEPSNEDITIKLAEVDLLRQKNSCTLPSSLQIEKAINPFLRCDQSTVMTAAQIFAEEPITNVVEIFSVIRSWKNQL